MFTAIYEFFCGTNDDPVYASDVYPNVGLFTLVLAIVFAIIFYLLLGRWKPVWDKTVHWIISLVILVAIAFYLALSQSKSATGEDADSFMYKCSLINALIATFYFFIFSAPAKKNVHFCKAHSFLEKIKPTKNDKKCLCFWDWWYRRKNYPLAYHVAGCGRQAYRHA